MRTSNCKSIIIFLLLFTPVISLINSNIMNQTVISITNNHSGDALNTQAETNSGLTWSACDGLAGVITTKPLLVKPNLSDNSQIVIIGSDVSVSAFDVETGELLWYHLTPGAVLSLTLVDDINDDDYYDLLLTHEDQLFPNVELLDGATGEIEWTFSPTELAWKDGVGYSEQETKSWSGLLIDDINSDNVKDVVVSSYRSLFALSGLNGEFLWKISSEDDIWSTVEIDDVNSDGLNDIVFGDQNGRLVLVSATDGTIIWNVLATEAEKYVDTILGTFWFDRSVFDILAVKDLTNDGLQDIMITNENGYCAVYSSSSGQLIDRIKIYSRTGEVPQETSYGERGFYNVRVKELTSNYEDTLYLSIGFSSSSIGNNSMTYFTLDENSMVINQTLTPYEGIIGIATCVEEDYTGNYTKMAVPGAYSGSSSNNLTIDIYSLNNHSIINQFFISVYGSASSTELQISEQSYTYPFRTNYALFADNFHGTDDNELLIYLEGFGLYALDGENGDLLWRQTQASSFSLEPFADINDDNTVDLLRKEYYYPDSYQTDVYYYPKFTVISGATGEVIWSHEVAYENQSLVNGGFFDIINAGDITGDNITDFWTVIQEKSHMESALQNASRIQLIDGKNGSVVWDELPTDPAKVYSKEQLRITSIISVSDQNSDSKRDLLVGCQRSYLYCISGATGEYLWNLTRETWVMDQHYRSWIPWDPQIFNAGDITGNYTEDLFIVGDNTIRLIEMDNYSQTHWSYTVTDGWLDETSLLIHFDNNTSEFFLAYSYNADEEWTTRIVNIFTGTLLMEFSFELSNADLQLFFADFTGDGIRDHLLFRPYSDEYFGDGLYIIDGVSNSIISYFNFYRDNYDYNSWIIDQLYKKGFKHFFDVISDVDGDNKPDLVYGWSLGRYSSEDSNQGMILEIVSVAEILAEPIATFEIVKEKQDEWSYPPLLPATFVRNLGDVSGDGNEDIILSLLTPTQDILTSIVSYESSIINPEANCGIWKQITTPIFDVLNTSQLDGILENKMVYTDIYGLVRVIADDFLVTIDNFETIQKNNGRYQLDWSCSIDNVISTIYINRDNIGSTSKTNFDVYLTNGLHNISIAVSDRNGIAAYANLSIEIEKVGGVFMIWLIIGGVLIAYISLKLYFRFRKKEDLTQFGPQLNLES